jgi:hypothetical protein
VNAAQRLATWATGVAVVGAFAWTARGDTRPSVVVCGEGSDGEALALRLGSHASASYRLSSADAWCKSLSSGRGAPLAAAASGHASGAKLVARARSAAQSAHADAAILVVARKSRRGTVVHVWVVDANGAGVAEVDQDVALVPGSSADDGADALWSVVAPALPSRRPVEAEGASAPAKPPVRQSPDRPQPPAEDTPDSDLMAASEPPAGADQGTPNGDSPAHPRSGEEATAIGVVRAGFEVGSREFSYVDRLTPTLRSYSLFAAPLAVVEGELYPLARAGVPILKDLGATLDYAMAFGVSSSDASGDSVNTAWSSFDAGARERIRLGPSVLLGLHGGYGENSFIFSGALGTTAELPSVRYRFVRGGADARVALGSLSFQAYGSYLGVLSSGPIGTYFQRATIGGIEGRVGATQAIGHGFELSLEVAYERFFYTLNPQPGDHYVAGGALDQMAFGSVGAAYVF